MCSSSCAASDKKGRVKVRAGEPEQYAGPLSLSFAEGPWCSEDFPKPMLCKCCVSRPFLPLITKHQTSVCFHEDLQTTTQVFVKQKQPKLTARESPSLCLESYNSQTGIPTLLGKDPAYFCLTFITNPGGSQSLQISQAAILETWHHDSDRNGVRVALFWLGDTASWLIWQTKYFDIYVSQRV